MIGFESMAIIHAMCSSVSNELDHLHDDLACHMDAMGQDSSDKWLHVQAIVGEVLTFVVIVNQSLEEAVGVGKVGRRNAHLECPIMLVFLPIASSCRSEFLLCHAIGGQCSNFMLNQKSETLLCNVSSRNWTFLHKNVCVGASIFLCKTGIFDDVTMMPKCKLHVICCEKLLFWHVWPIWGHLLLFSCCDSQIFLQALC